MTAPEPLDEYPAAPAETRGGDRVAAWQFPEYDSEGTFPAAPAGFSPFGFTDDSPDAGEDTE